jgi:hypothetical protein
MLNMPCQLRTILRSFGLIRTELLIGGSAGAGSRAAGGAPHSIMTPTRSSSAPTCSPYSSSTERTDEPRHHRPDPRLLGDPAQLGALEGALRTAGLPSAHPGLPRLRGRGRGPQRRPDPDREPDRARRHRPPHRRDRRAGTAADPDGPLRRRSVHPAHAGSRLRRGGRGDQLSPHRRACPWCPCRSSSQPSRYC